MSEVRFHTPEDVEVAYQPAGPGTRYLAVFVDQVIILLITIVLVVAAVFVSVGLAPYARRLERVVEGSAPEAVIWFTLVVVFLLKFLLDTAYYILFEIIMNGQTPGKRYMKIQVIQDGGYPLTATASFLRNLMRIVDNIPLCWPVLLFSREHKRIGDYVAGTLVVSKAPAPSVTSRVQGALYSELPVRQFEFTSKHLAQLTADDLELIESYFERRPKLKPEVARRLLGRVSGTLLMRLDLPPVTAPQSQQRFLVELGAFLREQSLKRQI